MVKAPLTSGPGPIVEDERARAVGSDAAAEALHVRVIVNLVALLGCRSDRQAFSPLALLSCAYRPAAWKFLCPQSVRHFDGFFCLFMSYIVTDKVKQCRLRIILLIRGNWGESNAFMRLEDLARRLTLNQRVHSSILCTPTRLSKEKQRVRKNEARRLQAAN